MNNNSAYQQALNERYRQIEQLNRLRESQKKNGLTDMVPLSYKITQMLGQSGKSLGQSSNPMVSKFGNGLYKYTGQEFVDNFKKNPWDTTTNSFNNIRNKLGFTGQGTQTSTGAGLNSLNNSGIMSSSASNFNLPVNNSSPITSAITGGNQGSALTSAMQGTGNQSSALSGALSNATSTGAKGAGSALGGAGGALGAAGSLFGGLSAANNFANKNYIDGGIDAASTVASFIPVYGWAAAAALQGAKMIKNMFTSGKEEELQKIMQQSASKNMEKAQETKQNAMQNIANNKIEQQPIVQDEMKQKIWDAYNTQLTPGEEAGYQIAKSNSPFTNDTGSDYDLRGYYNKYGGFGTDAENGHLTDEFKKPNHPTFSTESNFYDGQPYAVDWNKTPNYDSAMTSSPFSDYLSSLSDEDFNKLYNMRRFA